MTTQRPLLRPTLRAAASLILGAITTLAVAWGASAFTRPSAFPIPLAYPPAALSLDGGKRHIKVDWSVAAASSEWHSQLVTYHFPEPIPEFVTDPPIPADLRPILLPWLHAHPPRPMPTEGTKEQVRINAFGWPCLALCTSSTFIDDRTGNPRIRIVFRGMFFSALLRNLQARGLPIKSETLPTLPLYRGIIFNSLFFAAPWFILLLAAGPGRRALRTRRRRRRGLCAKCGYDLRGEFEKGCPECGWNKPGGAS